MTEGATKKCPFCAEDIKAEASVCKHCARDLTGRTTLKVKSGRKPWIGLLGLALAVIGLLASSDLGLGLILLGMVVLAYALITGNVRLFG